MGQKVKVDEHEGGVWSSILYSLAEPLFIARPRQGRLVPVHCVNAGSIAELCCCELPVLPSYWPDLNEHETPHSHFYFSFRFWI